MNNNEFLAKLNGYLAQINELAEEVNKLAEEYKHSEQVEVVGHEQYTLELLKDYVDSFSYAKDPDHPTDMYWVEYNSVCHGFVSGDTETIMAFEDFSTKAYAEKLRKMNRLNGMMLAFKYCYDRDYEPDWNDEDVMKFSVVYDRIEGFRYFLGSATQLNQVFFSSVVIAKKCAEWLNKVAESEDLI